MNWVQPKFSDFVAPSQPKKRKYREEFSDSKSSARQRTKIEDVEKELGTVSWTVRYAPKKRADLIVNKKKVEEIEAWLKSDQSDFLLLTGPSGCGKLTTLRIVCKELGIGTSEWITPETRPFEPGVYDDLYVSQSRAFEEFVLRAARYPSLLTPTTRRIVIVKDIPPTFIREPFSFHSLLERCADGTKIAFIISENNVSTELFPDEIRIKCHVKTVTLNAATKRALSTLLCDVARHEAPGADSRNIATSLAEAANGDIRQGLAALQFYITGAGKPTKLMDPNVDLFRAVGRAMYAKREANGQLVHRPEDVAASCPPNTFMGLLHENYPSIVDDLKTAVSIANGLALGDSLAAHSELIDIAADTAARVVMVENIAPVRKFQAFSRSRSRPVEVLCSELRMSVTAAFSSSDVTTIMTDCSLLQKLPQALTPPQKDVINRLSSYNLVKSLPR